MSNQTQGTWTFEKDICHATGQPCFHIGTKECGHTIGLAYEKDDAALIAAAPELLEALESFVFLYKQGQLVIEGNDGNDPVVASALAAITKATGEKL